MLSDSKQRFSNILDHFRKTSDHFRNIHEWFFHSKIGNRAGSGSLLVDAISHLLLPSDILTCGPTSIWEKTSLHAYPLQMRHIVRPSLRQTAY